MPDVEFQILYGPPWPNGYPCPAPALATFIRLSLQGFQFTVPEPGRLLVTPPHDDGGQAVPLSLDDRETIKKFKAHFVTLATECDKPFPLRGHMIELTK